jgi:hypothetical protein
MFRSPDSSIMFFEASARYTDVVAFQVFHASENIHVSHAYLLACRAVARSEPAFALWASARQPPLASPQAGNMACRAGARKASEGWWER